MTATETGRVQGEPNVQLRCFSCPAGLPPVLAVPLCAKYLDAEAKKNPATYFVDSYRMFFQQQIRAFEIYSHNIHPQKNPWNEV